MSKSRHPKTRKILLELDYFDLKYLHNELVTFKDQDEFLTATEIVAALMCLYGRTLQIQTCSLFYKRMKDPASLSLSNLSSKVVSELTVFLEGDSKFIFATISFDKLYLLFIKKISEKSIPLTTKDLES